MAYSNKIQGLISLACCVGGALGGFLGGQLYVYTDNQVVLIVSAIAMLAALPLVYQPDLERKQDDEDEEHTTYDHFKQVFEILKVPLMYKAAIYLFASSCLPDKGSTGFYYLTNHLNIDRSVMAWRSTVSGVCGILGNLIFYFFCRHVDPRSLMFWGTIVLTILGSSQLLLYTRANIAIGIPDVTFLFLDDVVLSVLSSILTTPVYSIIAMLCPKGMEGSLFCIFTSLMWTGSQLSTAWSATLLYYFNITAHNFDNIVPLYITCASIGIVPLFFMWMLPSEDDIKDIQNASQGLFLAEPAFSKTAANRLMKPVVSNDYVLSPPEDAGTFEADPESLAGLKTEMIGQVHLTLSNKNLDGLERFVDAPRYLSSHSNLEKLVARGWEGSGDDLDQLYKGGGLKLT